jgi:predicted dehydrogenase
MALTLADADRMIDVCAEEEVCLGVAYQRRAEPLFRDVHRAVAGGALGELTMGTVTMPYVRDEAYYASADWRGTWALDGGGVLMNQGIHLIDLLIWYMGDPVEVRAFAATLHRPIEVEDTLAATLRFENGALATVAATTTAAPGFAHGLAVYGTHGGFQVEGEQIRSWRQAGQAHNTPPASAGGADAVAGGDPMAIAPTGHIRLLRDFIEAARTGSPPLVDGVEGRRSLAAVLAIYDASGVKSA